MTESYRRHLAASVLVLSELDLGRPTGGLSLREQINRRCQRASAQDPSFDFVGWCGATFWEFLDVLASSRFLRAVSRTPRSTIEWSEAEVVLTDSGIDFVEEVRPVVADLLQPFAVDTHVEARSVA